MNRTRHTALCAVLISLALVLSYAERFFPLQMIVPLPGVKLGLANIVSIIALYRLGGRSAAIILAIRCILGSAFGGGITSLMFSLTGGALSIIVMCLSRRLPFLSVYGVSILGAAAHNIGQICASMVLMHSIYIGAYLPYLLGVSLFTGFATGAAASGVLRVFYNIDHDRPDGRLQ